MSEIAIFYQLSPPLVICITMHRPFRMAKMGSVGWLFILEQRSEERREPDLILLDIGPHIETSRSRSTNWQIRPRVKNQSS